MAASILCVWLGTLGDVEDTVATILRILVVAFSKLVGFAIMMTSGLRACVRFLTDGGLAGVLRDFILGIVLA